MSGDPRYAIHVSALVFQLAHAHARRIGFPTTSDWLRALLWAWDDEPLSPRPRRTKELSVRLSPPLQARLAHIARVSGTSQSEVFAILVERALFDAVADACAAGPPQRTRPAKRQGKPKPPRSSKRARAKPPPGARATATALAIPAPDDHAGWAQAIHDAARRTPHTFGPNKAFIAGVIEELIARFEPRDPDAFRAQVRALLPVLNRLDLIELTRADLVGSMDPRLVRDSAIRYLNAEFHFVTVA